MTRASPMLLTLSLTQNALLLIHLGKHRRR
jgi:hypothetical protein